MEPTQAASKTVPAKKIEEPKAEYRLANNEVKEIRSIENKSERTSVVQTVATDENQLGEAPKEKITTKVNTNKIGSAQLSKQEEKCNCPDDFKNESISQEPLEARPSVIKKNVETDPIGEEKERETISELGNLKSLGLLPLKKVKSSIPECGEYEIKPKRRKLISGVGIYVGAIKETIAEDYITDTVDIYPTFGLRLEFKNIIGLNLSFSKVDHNVVYSDQFPDYSFIQGYNPIGDWMIRDMTKRVKTWNLDCTLDKDILRWKRLSLNVSGGARFTQVQSNNLSVFYEGIYISTTENFEVPAESLRASYVIGGLAFQYNLDSLRFSIGYKRFQAIGKSVFSWNNRNALHAGVNYTLNL